MKFENGTNLVQKSAKTRIIGKFWCFATWLVKKQYELVNCNKSFSLFLTCRSVISSRLPSFLTDRRVALPCEGYPSSTLRWHTVVAVLRKIRSFSAGHQSIANLTKQAKKCTWDTGSKLLYSVKPVFLPYRTECWDPVLLN